LQIVMMLPNRIDAAWIGGLSDVDLRCAERVLRARLANEEALERARVGRDYDVLSGPEALTSSWLRWWMVRRAGHTRGLGPSR
jgi:hypothetical protein